jgi:hypothetical protein
LVTQTNATRLGLNTNSPQYTFDFYSYNRASRLYFDDSSNPNLYQIVLSGGSNTLIGHSSYSSGSYGIQFGIRGNTNTTYDAVGAAGDTFIFSNTLSNNFIIGYDAPINDNLTLKPAMHLGMYNRDLQLHC